VDRQLCSANELDCNMKKDLAARGEGFKLRKKPTSMGIKRNAPDEDKADQNILDAKRALSARDPPRSNVFSAGRFHDLGLAEVVAEHLHGKRLYHFSVCADIIYAEEINCDFSRA
jgi:hypothetical protein